MSSISESTTAQHRVQAVPDAWSNSSAALPNTSGWWRSFSTSIPGVSRLTGPYRGLLDFVLATLITFAVLRAAMLLAYADHSLLNAGTLFRVFLVGLRFDLLVGLCLVLLGAVHLTFVPSGRRLGLLSRLWMEFGWMFAAVFLPVMCVVEWLFFDEFQTRLNYIAFEYLVYPTEVCCNVWQSYQVVPILAAVASVGGSFYIAMRQRLLRSVAVPLALRGRLLILAALVASIGGLWSTLSMDSRNVSPDRVAVECAGNGVYSFVYYAMTCRFEWDDSYVTVGDTEAVQRVRRRVVRPDDRPFAGSANPVDRIVSGPRDVRDWNVVLILEESFGSDFVGVQGDNRGLTPEFDALSQKGLLFDNWYSTGNRTARALEAVMTSMPPLPTESILKRDHSDRVHTIANVLADRGYATLFISAGRGIFDGVRSFMTSNGFDRFIEQQDFVDPEFVNAWGVSDEDLFARALKELDELQAADRPFFATLLTVSNHRPYTYPDGRIESTNQSRRNAVRYADWALGRFFRQAQSHDFYKNTLFVVMGDHGARIYGSQMFPLRSYRVPVLLISPDDAGRGQRCPTLACSLDVAPTILGRLGGEYRSVFFGRDVLTTAVDEGRAVMQHNHDVAVLTPDHHLVTLGFGKASWQYLVDPDTLELQQTHAPADGHVRDAAALFQLTHDLYYSDRWYPDADVRQSPLGAADGEAPIAAVSGDSANLEQRERP